MKEHNLYDSYWYINASGEVKQDFWNDSSADQLRRKFLGVYPTREEAKEALGIIKSRVIIRDGKIVIWKDTNATTTAGNTTVLAVETMVTTKAGGVYWGLLEVRGIMIYELLKSHNHSKKDAWY